MLTWTSEPAVVLLNNVYYDTGINAQEQHVAVGDWYHVTHVSIKDTLYQEMKVGVYTREELTPDGLHPNDKGHGLVVAEIIKFLEKVKEDTKTDFPVPLTGNAYEHAQRQRRKHHSI